MEICYRMFAVMWVKCIIETVSGMIVGCAFFLSFSLSMKTAQHKCNIVGRVNKPQHNELCYKNKESFWHGPFLLTFTIPWANSADDKLIFLFLFFSENRI